MNKKRRMLGTLAHNWQLWVMLLPALAWLVVFVYAPMYGLVIAFKDFKPRAGITGSPWVTPLLKHFAQFFSTNIARNTVVNTLILSLLTILISFPVPIIFAILLNQIKRSRIRRTIQTISYAPYFISTVVVISIMNVILAPGSGFVNTIYTTITGNSPLLFTSRPEYFRPLYVISNIWQSMGFSAIIYIAALTGISPDYYEAATVDGANKFKRILYIDIPLIMPTAIIMFILAIGNIMTVGYEKVYLMQNGMNTVVSEIISTYVFKSGLQNAQYSFATAVGLFNSGVNFIILLICNMVAKRTADISIF